MTAERLRKARRRIASAAALALLFGGLAAYAAGWVALIGYAVASVVT